MVDLFETNEEDVCPKCKTARKTFNALQLLYSSCCGSRLCTSCVQHAFHAKRKVECADCGKKIDKSKFKKEPYEVQKYRDIAKVRARVNAVFNLRRKDFESEVIYNNFLEKIEDVVYDLVYGSAKEKTVADAYVDNFRKENMGKITANNLQTMQEEKLRKQLEAKGASPEQSVAPVVTTIRLPPGPAQQNFPDRLQVPPTPVYTTMHPEEGKRVKVQREKLKLRVLVAQGWERTGFRKRNQQEARDCILYFPNQEVS